MPRIVVLYPNTPGARFDMDYYTSTHIPLVRSVLGDAVVEASVHKGVDVPGAPPAAFVASAAIEFRDMASLGAALQQGGGKLAEDMPNFTTITPTMQIEEKVL